MDAGSREPVRQPPTGRPSGGGTPPPGYGRPQSFVGRLLEPAYGHQAVWEPAEVAALMKYASEKGIDTDDHLLARLFRSLEEYQQNPMSVATVNGEPVPKAELILRDYTNLTRLTEGINGRTLLHGRQLMVETKWFLLVTTVFFILSIGSLAYGAWIVDETSADDPILSPIWSHLILYFAPFAWGALGSCVYILKRVTDEAAANKFDRDKFQGWLTRALLGAVLGGTITYLIDADAFGTVSLSLTAIAFLTGLGTKVVYGGLERMIELLAEKMNLAAIRKAPVKGDAVTAFLAREVAQTDPEAEPEKYQVLVTLLESRTPAREGATP